ncbi:MAG: hypothetical protein ACAH83_10310 [Alphaproteobacteria bacterium]
MKVRGLKYGIATFACMVWGLSVLSTSFAEKLSFLNTGAETTVNSGSAGTAVGMNAEFMTAATFKVEHEPFTVGSPGAVMDIHHIVTREAYVTIGGLPGETVLLTCDVSSRHDASTRVRDCGGEGAVQQHEIKSGQKLDNGVLLTNDLMPNDTGVSESTVSFEVSYL